MADKNSTLSGQSSAPAPPAIPSPTESPPAAQAQPESPLGQYPHLMKGAYAAFGGPPVETKGGDKE